ncbi:MAG: hypothetical protein RMK18_11660 [Armatimonadota bacterium]|nr:hypothetical protein [Armatimonadota bacterium]MDW8026502.1 hypothetical protein [Armatimonadota bacterium]
MALLETTGRLEVTVLTKLIFVVDVSKSAGQRWAEIAPLKSQVLASLPAGIRCSLYFLGNPSAYEPIQFAVRCAQRYNGNRKRASLITPIFETLTGDEEITIVIISSGKIFDLDDWVDTSIVKRTLLVNMSESLQGDSSAAEEVIRPTAQQIYQRLHDPVTAVEIFGVGFIPAWWDNSGYNLRIANGKASLKAEQLNDYSITLRFLIEAGFSPQARLTHASGKETSATIHPVEVSVTQEPECIPLIEKEQEIFRNAVNKASFTCLHCQTEHSWDTLYCLLTATILGKFVYPSLSEQKVKWFVVFRQIGSSIYFKSRL